MQARKTYPIGHPEIILKDFEPIETYFGLIKCTVLPPRKLLHLLLYRSNPHRGSYCSLSVAPAQNSNFRSCCTAMKKDTSRGFGPPWNFRTLLLKGIRLSKLLKSGTFLRHQTIYSADMLRRFSNSSKRLQDFPPGSVRLRKGSIRPRILRRREFNSISTK